MEFLASKIRSFILLVKCFIPKTPFDFVYIQAILFYIPRWLWKNWEAGKIHALMMDLDIGVVQDVEKRQKKRLLLDYLADNLKHHNWWAYRYFFCEFLALVNIIGNYNPTNEVS